MQEAGLALVGFPAGSLLVTVTVYCLLFVPREEEPEAKFHVVPAENVTVGLLQVNAAPPLLLVLLYVIVGGVPDGVFASAELPVTLTCLLPGLLKTHATLDNVGAVRSILTVRVPAAEVFPTPSVDVHEMLWTPAAETVKLPVRGFEPLCPVTVGLVGAMLSVHVRFVTPAWLSLPETLIVIVAGSSALHQPLDPFGQAVPWVTDTVGTVTS